MLSRARRKAQRAQSKPNLTHFGLACQVWVLSGTFLAFGGGARMNLTFLPRISRSGTRLTRYSRETEFKALTLTRQSLRRRSGVTPKPRLHSDGAFGRSAVAAQILAFGRHFGSPGHPKSLNLSSVSDLFAPRLPRWMPLQQLVVPCLA